MIAVGFRFIASRQSFFFYALCIVLASCSSISSNKRDRLWSPEMPAEIAGQAPSIDLSKLERAIHEETNAEREQRGLAPLVWSDTIAYVARQHSQDMAQKGYFGHINQEGMKATQRAAAVGLDFSHRSGQYMIEGLGENLFATHRYEEYVVSEHDSGETTYKVNWKTMDEMARESIDAWLNSPKHRANLLSRDYVHQGIGAALGSNGTLFVTQNLN